jgi:hypothetical protein
MTEVFDLVIIARREGSVDDRTLWDDLRVCLYSVEAYAPEVRCVVAWEGPYKPDRMPEHANIEFLEREPNLSLSKALTWAVRQTQTLGFVTLQDDAVLHPDTISMLRDDLVQLKAEGRVVGMLASRSNFVVGVQNIRASNNGTLLPNMLRYTTETETIETDYLYPVCAWWDRAAYEHIGGLGDGLYWYADTMYSHDLAKIGYERHVSRSYVHHVGMRSSGEPTAEQGQRFVEESLAWLRTNRPDFYKMVNLNG